MRFNNFKATKDLKSHVGNQRDFQGPQNQNQSWKNMPKSNFEHITRK
jgi:hypothetical protein